MNENTDTLIMYVQWAREHGLVAGYWSTLQAYLARHRKAEDKKALKRLVRILDELREYPDTGFGQSEQLKHEWTGYWPRKITETLTDLSDPGRNGNGADYPGIRTLR